MADERMAHHTTGAMHVNRAAEAVAWVQAEFDALWESPFAVPLAEFVVQDLDRLWRREPIGEINRWREQPEPASVVVEASLYGPDMPQSPRHIPPGTAATTCARHCTRMGAIQWSVEVHALALRRLARALGRQLRPEGAAASA